MSDKIFIYGRTVDSVAYDLALALATKEAGDNSAYTLLTLIKKHLPECREMAEKFFDDETPPPATNVNIGFVR
ncbi:hypothetical protein MHZ90_14790 [Pantoea sp. ACRSH]|uniref:hypothetical protein n=1 Tax=unclassified Pantoea TaxID=2630326 RepID=UPI001EF528E7|nr:MULTISPECIES: hypothetical protein [unclassified Pantoea]MCG7367388.1 hypothetical protein [Pantoea sp. ACRSH]MCG7397681.1 hypothetical protein [Pantoea sp. ACRSC]